MEVAGIKAGRASAPQADAQCISRWPLGQLFFSLGIKWFGSSTLRFLGRVPGSVSCHLSVMPGNPETIFENWTLGGNGYSGVVEHTAHNQEVVGLIPARPRGFFLLFLYSQ